MAETWWTSEEVGRLRAMLLQGLQPEQIAPQLNRTAKAVRNKISKLGWGMLLQKETPPAAKDEANVKCPFFCSFLEDKRIRCEGVCMARRTILVFDTPQQWREHIEKYCDKDFQNCPIAEVLSDQYE